MKCYKCRKEISENQNFCTKCGAPQKFTDELIQRAIKDQDAFFQLYEMTKDNVYYTIKAMIKDEDTVQDLVQDTYVKAFKCLPQLRDAAAFRGWIKQIAKNLAIDVFRKKKVIPFSEMLSMDSEEMIEFEDERIDRIPESILDKQETARLLGEILDKLPEEQRLVVIMYHVQEKSVKEISEILDVSEGTIKSRLNYGRKKIRMEVCELEKKGTKLYNLAPIPFLLWLFRSQEAYAAELPDKEIMRAVVKEMNSGSGTDLDDNNRLRQLKDKNAENISKVSNMKEKQIIKNSLGIRSIVMKNTTGIVSKSVLFKIVASIVTVAVIGGGTIAGIKTHQHKQEENNEIIMEVDTGNMDESLVINVSPEEKRQIEEAVEAIEEQMEADRIMHEEFQNYQESKAEVSARIKENEFKKMKECYMEYLSSREGDSADKVIADAEAFNKAFDEYAQAALESGYFREQDVKSSIISAFSISEKLEAYEFKGIADYIRYIKNTDYDRMVYAYDEETSEHLFCVKRDEENDCYVVRSDGSICEVNVTEMFPDVTEININSLNQELLVLEVERDDMGILFSFDITGDTAVMIDENVQPMEDYIIISTKNDAWLLATEISRTK